MRKTGCILDCEFLIFDFILCVCVIFFFSWLFFINEKKKKTHTTIKETYGNGGGD